MKRSVRRMATRACLRSWSARLASVALVVLVPGLMAVQSASATGSEYIGGTAVPAYRFYYNPRTVTNSALPGPEVAFSKDSGPATLFLGTHNCNVMSPSIIGGGPFAQQLYTWRPVGNALANGTQFCIVTEGIGGGGPSFNGTLAWD